MVSIFSGLGTAKDALAAQQAALEVTQNNIANVNTRGYTRKRVDFRPTDTWNQVTSFLMTGAPKVAIESFRNRFLEYRLSEEFQSRGEYAASSGALQQIDSILNENSGQGLQNVLSNFFNSFDALANSPEDMTLRQQVLSRANELASGFHRLYSRIQAVQTGQERSIANTMKEINAITEQIARLNPQIAAAQSAQDGRDASLRDQRGQLLEELSGLIDVSSYESESGSLTITTRKGAPLVIGDQSRALQAGSTAATGFLQVYLDGQNITSQIQSGKLGGMLKMRDTTIPGYLSKLDDMAATLIARVNTQHAQGSDYSGAPGGDFFVPFVPAVIGSTAGAASTISVQITDANKIAAASAGAGPGSNGNARLLAAIRDEKLFDSGSTTANEFYSHLIYTVGLDSRAAEESLQTQNQVLLQLQNQKDSEEGVNLDEEATNIIRFQKAYEASARLVQIWDSIAETTINLLGR